MGYLVDKLGGKFLLGGLFFSYFTLLLCSQLAYFFKLFYEEYLYWAYYQNGGYTYKSNERAQNKIVEISQQARCER